MTGCLIAAYVVLLALIVVALAIPPEYDPAFRLMGWLNRGKRQ